MIGEPLFAADEIAARVADLGAAISRDYAGTVPLIVGLETAATPFLDDLLQAITIPHDADLVAVNRYGEADGVALRRDTAIPVAGRHAIVVDDTIDTGLTLQYVRKMLLAREPASLEVCTLLDRPRRRIADISVKYRGFELPDVYVVGYGLDYAGRYRELPALYAHGTWPR